jgi:subtilisin-like proprotein convertase family protein
MLANAAGSQFGYYDITFSAATDNAPLRIELSVAAAGGTPVGANSCVSLLAAKLSDLPNTSGSVSISVNNSPKGFWTEENVATVTVNASHPNNVRGVELFYDNQAVLPADLTPPYEFAVPLKAGPGKLHAEVTTMLGTTFKSTSVPLNVFHVVDNLGELAIPDAGDWVESVLRPSTPTTRTVKEAIAWLTIEHPYVGDLEFRLESPNGRSILLSSENGGSGHDYFQTTFWDGATPITQGSAPFSAVFAPQEPLAGLIGEAFSGPQPWRFRVRDKYASDVGSVKYVKLFLLVE